MPTSISALVRRTILSATPTAILLVGASCGRAIQPGSAQATQLDSAISDSAFAALSISLSENGGFFDTDNLISNESSYLQVLGALRSGNVAGGAYLGVGPGQNFSYIAQIRPRIAFVVDIRRDNLLQHLLYKALFESSDTRVEFLGRLFGRDVGVGSAESSEWSIEEVVRFVESAPRTAGSVAAAVRTVLDSAGRTGIPLAQEDLATIERFHRTFINAGFDLRFNSFGRAPQPYYPTFRRLLLEVDLEGNQANYLTSEEGYRLLREMERRNLVIPVVGNLAGEHAMGAIAEWLANADLVVSAFYTSNVEFYLWQDGSFGRFAANVGRMPRNRSSVIIRSYFGGGFRRGPRVATGYANAQLVQTMDEFVSDWESGRYRTYLDVVWD